jgi:lipoprotein-releasing system permease protein
VGLIVATMIMLGLEKRKELAVFKALGVSDGGIVKLFMLQGLQIGATGGALGLASGVAWCLAIEKLGLQLDSKIYYISSLPVHLDGVQVFLAFVIAVLVTFLASVYPAIQASQVEPAQGLKSE